ncbi:uncharacterized protein LOC141855511 [Brevipalpus obovatus]|uniref:uncharacterized protein LOC141855511 n=1 Tax=Brevipalpus obovatus TaxID=246614 RepID=UPI003D9F9758
MKFLISFVALFLIADAKLVGDLPVEPSDGRNFVNADEWVADLTNRHSLLREKARLLLDSMSDLSPMEKFGLNNTLTILDPISMYADFEKQALKSAEKLVYVIPGLKIGKCEFDSHHFDCLLVDDEDEDFINESSEMENDEDFF